MSLKISIKCDSGVNGGQFGFGNYFRIYFIILVRGGVWVSYLAI